MKPAIGGKVEKLPVVNDDLAYSGDVLRNVIGGKDEIKIPIMSPSVNDSAIEYDIADNNFDNRKSYDYFMRNIHDDAVDSGPAFLVGQSITGTKDGYKLMKKDDVLLHLLLSKFTAGLTVSQKHQLTIILQLITDKFTTIDEK